MMMTKLTKGVQRNLNLHEITPEWGADLDVSPSSWVDATRC